MILKPLRKSTGLTIFYCKKKIESLKIKRTTSEEKFVEFFQYLFGIIGQYGKEDAGIRKILEEAIFFKSRMDPSSELPSILSVFLNIASKDAVTQCIGGFLNILKEYNNSEFDKVFLKILAKNKTENIHTIIEYIRSLDPEFCNNIFEKIDFDPEDPNYMKYVESELDKKSETDKIQTLKKLADIIAKNHDYPVDKKIRFMSEVIANIKDFNLTPEESRDLFDSIIDSNISLKDFLRKEEMKTIAEEFKAHESGILNYEFNDGKKIDDAMINTYRTNGKINVIFMDSGMHGYLVVIAGDKEICIDSHTPIHQFSEGMDRIDLSKNIQCDEVSCRYYTSHTTSIISKLYTENPTMTISEFVDSLKEEYRERDIFINQEEFEDFYNEFNSGYRYEKPGFDDLAEIANLHADDAERSFLKTSEERSSFIADILSKKKNKEVLSDFEKIVFDEAKQISFKNMIKSIDSTLPEIAALNQSFEKLFIFSQYNNMKIQKLDAEIKSCDDIHEVESKTKELERARIQNKKIGEVLTMNVINGGKVAYSNFKNRLIEENKYLSSKLINILKAQYNRILLESTELNNARSLLEQAIYSKTATLEREFEMGNEAVSDSHKSAVDPVRVALSRASAVGQMKSYGINIFMC